MMSYPSSASSPSSVHDRGLTPNERSRDKGVASSTPPSCSSIGSDLLDVRLKKRRAPSERALFSASNNTFMEYQDVGAVMSDALVHLGRITEHLREKDSNGAANEIAKHTISILNLFNDAIADWDISKCLLKNPPAITVAASEHVERNVRIIRNGATADEYVRSPGAGSWATVAATATDRRNRVVNFPPGDGHSRTMRKRPEVPVTPQDARVVWIKPWNLEKQSLSDITEKIEEGPLFSIAHSQPDDAVCVIFQHAHHARAFLEANDTHARLYGHGLFGPDGEVLEGQAYPTTEDIRSMEIKNERRRLTFARCRLFSDGMTEARFKQDIFSIVGKGNVELVWLFNSGNATVVFSSTAIARTVRTEFLRRAAYPGPYQDIMVSFSHDPCERPLNLITQMPGSKSASGAKQVHGGTNDGVDSCPTGNGNLTRPCTASSRRGQRRRVDAEGWQTVGRRK